MTKSTRPHGIEAVIVPGAKPEIYEALGVRRGLVLDGPRPTIVFAVDDAAGAGELAARRGYHAPAADEAGVGYQFRATTRTATTPEQTDPSSRSATGQAADERGLGLGLDHVVLASHNADATIATLAGRFELSLRLDRVGPHGVRQLFFRTGPEPAPVIEVLVVEPGGGKNAPPGADEIWGLAWRSENLDADHARLGGAGFDLSPIRVGAKPGTRIFSVRDRSIGTRTVFIEPSPAPR